MNRPFIIRGKILCVKVGGRQGQIIQPYKAEGYAMKKIFAFVLERTDILERELDRGMQGLNGAFT